MAQILTINRKLFNFTAKCDIALGFREVLVPGSKVLTTTIQLSNYMTLALSSCELNATQTSAMGIYTVNLI